MKLDLDETLHLAIHAGATAQHHACLTYLREVLAEHPNHVKALYLQAAQHTTLGLIARAIAGLERVLSLDPEFGIARFQLALLLLDQGPSDAAARHLQQLSRAADAGLAALASAMLAHRDGAPAAAQGFLQTALSAPPENPALVDLVRRIVGGHRGESPAPPASVAGHAADAGLPVYLGAYVQAKP